MTNHQQTMIDLVNSVIATPGQDNPDVYTVTKGEKMLGFLVHHNGEFRPMGMCVTLHAFKGGEADHPWRSLDEALRGYDIAAIRDWFEDKKN